MQYKQPSFKLGVLNMTISFEKPQPRLRAESRMEHHSLKVSQINNFSQKYKDSIPRSNTIVPKKQDNSPYQTYRKSKKESIRYFREHSEEVEVSRNILGFKPHQNKTIQMQFNQDFNLEAEPKTVNRHRRDSHLRLIFNKRHLKQKKSPEHQPRIQRLSFHVENNPEQSLQSVFTVRQVKTSMRVTRNSHDKQLKQYLRLPASRQEDRVYEKKWRNEVDLSDKKIRPWSPTRRSPFNKQAFLESTILEGSNYPLEKFDV